MLNLVSEPSANMSVTILLLIHINFANLIGLNRETSGMGAVE